MTQARMMAIGTQPVTLTDGRVVKVREYPDGSVRVQVSGIEGKRYAMTECFLPGNEHDAIVKLELL